MEKKKKRASFSPSFTVTTEPTKKDESINEKDSAQTHVVEVVLDNDQN